MRWWCVWRRWRDDRDMRRRTYAWRISDWWAWRHGYRWLSFQLQVTRFFGARCPQREQERSVVVSNHKTCQPHLSFNCYCLLYQAPLPVASFASPTTQHDEIQWAFTAIVAVVVNHHNNLWLYHDNYCNSSSSWFSCCSSSSRHHITTTPGIDNSPRTIITRCWLCTRMGKSFGFDTGRIFKQWSEQTGFEQWHVGMSIDAMELWKVRSNLV